MSLYQQQIGTMTTARSLLSLVLLVIPGGAMANVPERPPFMRIGRSSREIRAESHFGRHLLAHARSLEENDMDFDFVAGYSLKFQGCHHVQQWNNEADDEDDVRIKTKRLVRFRLCPSGSCSSSKSAGCTSKYGDYVVDMNSFVYAYLNAMENDQDEICEDVAYDCNQECNGGDDEDCVEACYEAYDLTMCLNDDENNNDNKNGYEIDPLDFAYCANFDFGRRERRRLEDNQVQYYIGPYCADQGGEIHLGLFTDESCTTFAQNGESTFYSYTGYELPYSDDSLISTRCMSCGRRDDNNNNNNGGDAEVKEICENVYALAGKCETKMNMDYPNESSCSYIEGIKIIREDGVIRTSATRKSKAAAVCIGLFLTVAVLLAGYVYYLRTKLGRAKINLAAASHPLT